MGEAGHVHTFFSKMKLPPPGVSWEALDSDASTFECTIKLPAAFIEGQGFPEITFSDTGKNKKAAKNAAMKQAHAFLMQQPVYKNRLQSEQVKASATLLAYSISFFLDFTQRNCCVPFKWFGVVSRKLHYIS